MQETRFQLKTKRHLSSLVSTSSLKPFYARLKSQKLHKIHARGLRKAKALQKEV